MVVEVGAMDAAKSSALTGLARSRPMISAPTAPENGRISKTCGWALSMVDKAFKAADIFHSHAVRDFNGAQRSETHGDFPCGFKSCGASIGRRVRSGSDYKVIRAIF
jgi:hypothetical protein